MGVTTSLGGGGLYNEKTLVFFRCNHTSTFFVTATADEDKKDPWEMKYYHWISKIGFYPSIMVILFTLVILLYLSNEDCVDREQFFLHGVHLFALQLFVGSYIAGVSNVSYMRYKISSHLSIFMFTLTSQLTNMEILLISLFSNLKTVRKF